MIATILYTYLFIINLLVFIFCHSNLRGIEEGNEGFPPVLMAVMGWLGGAYGAMMGALMFGYKNFKAWYYIVVGIALLVWLVGLALLRYFN